MGWMEVFGLAQAGPFVAFAWIANPCLLLTWVFVPAGSRTLASFARVFATTGLCLGVGFLLFGDA
jgi:hypothetical protein